MQQLARPGFSQQGRFRLSVPADPANRIAPLQKANAGEIVTGLKEKTSSVSLLLVYNGRSYSELASAIKLEDEYRKVDSCAVISAFCRQMVLAERERLDMERKRLLEEKRLAEEEERRRTEKDAAEARGLAEEAVRKAQREAAVREQILQRQKEQLQRERERWIAEAKMREQEEEEQCVLPPSFSPRAPYPFPSHRPQSTISSSALLPPSKLSRLHPSPLCARPCVPFLSFLLASAILPQSSPVHIIPARTPRSVHATPLLLSLDFRTAHCPRSGHFLTP
eukprot:2004536-Rhodomonas_salina.1